MVPLVGDAAAASIVPGIVRIVEMAKNNTAGATGGMDELAVTSVDAYVGDSSPISILKEY